MLKNLFYICLLLLFCNTSEAQNFQVSWIAVIII